MRSRMGELVLKVRSDFCLRIQLRNGWSWAAWRSESIVVKLGVGERRVNLAVARAAQGRAVLGFTTLLFGREVVAGDQARGDRSAVELADGGGVVAHGWMVVRK